MDATTASPWMESASEQFAGEETEISPELIVGARALRHDCTDLLREAGLRPTQRRLLLGELLFGNGGRHLTADMLFTEAASAGANISRATVYNTLNQFTGAGLLRQIGVDGSKSYFDTNPTAHHHFFVDQEDRLLDVPEPGVLIDTLPQPLPGYEVAGVDVIVHLRRKQA